MRCGSGQVDTYGVVAPRGVRGPRNAALLGEPPRLEGHFRGGERSTRGCSVCQRPVGDPGGARGWRCERKGSGSQTGYGWNPVSRILGQMTSRNWAPTGCARLEAQRSASAAFPCNYQ